MQQKESLLLFEFSFAAHTGKVGSSNFNSFPEKVWVNRSGEFMMIENKKCKSNYSRNSTKMYEKTLEIANTDTTESFKSTNQSPSWITFRRKSQLALKELTFSLPQALGLSATPREWRGNVFALPLSHFFHSLSLSHFPLSLSVFLSCYDSDSPRKNIFLSLFLSLSLSVTSLYTFKLSVEINGTCFVLFFHIFT